MLSTAKWISDLSLFHLIKPKHDSWLFVDLAEFPCFYLLWTKICFCFYLQNNFLFTPGKFRGIQLNQQTLICHVLAWLKKIWNCLLFISCNDKKVPRISQHILRNKELKNLRKDLEVRKFDCEFIKFLALLWIDSNKSRTPKSL